MKKIKVIILLFIVVAAFSCNEEKIVNIEMTFEEELSQKLSLIQDADDDIVIAKKDGDKYDLDFMAGVLSFFYDDGMDFSVLETGRKLGPVCTGSGLSFANCCLEYLDAGVTLMIKKTSKGKYSAWIMPEE